MKTSRSSSSASKAKSTAAKGKKTAAKKTTAKAGAKKTVKKAAAKKTTAKKATTKKAAAKKTTAKKATAKKVGAKKTTAKKTAAKKTTAKKAAPKKAAAAKKAAPKKAAKPRAKKAAAAAAPAGDAPAGGTTEGALRQAAEGVARPPVAEIERAAAIVGRLRERYPAYLKSALDSRSPFELLVATILSAQCTDARVNTVTPALFAEFPDAAAMARANPERLKELIHSTGFFNNKAKALLEGSRILLERHGGRVPGSLDELVQLPGVGRKTAWCVLSAYFGQQGIIVDTHLKRVSGRLGLHAEEDAVKIEFALNDLVPELSRADFTHGLTHHGRVVCDARKPKCHDCFLADLCPRVGVA